MLEPRSINDLKAGIAQPREIDSLDFGAYAASVRKRFQILNAWRK
jgi:hypothetical protein